MYVSPFHGTDGAYDSPCPMPGDRLHIAVTLRTDDGAVFSASLTGTRTPGHASRRQAWRAAPAALRGSLLIRAHGIWLWAARLPVRPRPPHHPGRRAMTLAAIPSLPIPGRPSSPNPLARPRRNYRPGRDLVPAGPRAAGLAPGWRRLFRAAVSRLPVTVRRRARTSAESSAAAARARRSTGPTSSSPGSASTA